MGTDSIAIVRDLIMTSILLFLYLRSLSENAKLIEQNRTDQLRHEETILALVRAMGKCPALKED